MLPIEEKSNQMFGATIVASKNADSVLVALILYSYFSGQRVRAKKPKLRLGQILP